MADEDEYSADEHSLPGDIQEEQEGLIEQLLKPEAQEEQEQGEQVAVAAAAAEGAEQYEDLQPGPGTLDQPAAAGSPQSYQGGVQVAGASQDPLQHEDQLYRPARVSSATSSRKLAAADNDHTVLQPVPGQGDHNLEQHHVLWPPPGSTNPDNAATQHQPNHDTAFAPVISEPRQVSSHVGLSTLPSARRFVSQRHSMRSAAGEQGTSLLPGHQASQTAESLQPVLSRSNTHPDTGSSQAHATSHPSPLDEQPALEAVPPMAGEPMQATVQLHNGPGYQAPTHAMPNAPSADYSHASHQAVMLAFSPGSWFGIRSLPDALSPDFKQQLHQHFALHHGWQAQPGPPFIPPGGRLAPCAPDQMLGWEQLPEGPGLRPVARTHPYAGSFAMFGYLPSEYDRCKLGEKFDRLQGKVAQVTPVDFVVRSTPAAPKGAPAFSEFQHGFEPNPSAAQMRLDEENAARAGALAGPFVTVGRAKPPMSLRGRADDCMRALCKLLSYDWPTSFMQVFEDKSGAVVVCFDHSAAVLQGDLSAYMQQLAKNHWLTSEYRLTKDGTQWGLVDGDLVFYLLWPPWVRHRLIGPAPPAAKPPAITSPRPLQQPEEEASTEELTATTEPSYSPRGLDMASMGALSRSAAVAAAPGGTPLQSAGGRGGSATAKPCSRGAAGMSLSGLQAVQSSTCRSGFVDKPYTVAL